MSTTTTRKYYSGYTDAADALGVDKRLFKIAKANGEDWISGNKIFNCKAMLDYVAEHRNDDFDNADGERVDAELRRIKLENLKKDGQLKDLEIKKRQENLLTIDEVEHCLTTIANLQSGILAKCAREIGVKLSGKSAGEIETELAKEFGILIDTIKTSMERLIDAPKIS